VVQYVVTNWARGRVPARRSLIMKFCSVLFLVTFSLLGGASDRAQETCSSFTVPKQLSLARLQPPFL
jgi:hypothetical protein